MYVLYNQSLKDNSVSVCFIVMRMDYHFDNPSKCQSVPRGSPAPGVYQVRILELSGKLVKECKRYVDVPAELNTPDLAAGCYILQLTGAERVLQSRIVKQ